MLEITSLTDDSDQIWSMNLQDGTTAQFELIYKPRVQRWYMNITHPSIPPAGQVNGLGVSVYPNLVRRWNKILTWGLACTTIDGEDPVYLTDWTSGRAAMYLLENAAEVLQVEQNLFQNAFI